MRMLSNLELSAFCSQLSMVLKAGISAAEGVNIMERDAAEGDEKVLLAHLAKSLQDGKDLSKALSEAGCFPAYLCRMAGIGESTGTLDEVFLSLSRYYERQEGLSRSIRSAFTYPLLMIGVMALVVAVLLTKVMPVFAQVFKQLGLTMGGFSKGALVLGQGMSRYALVIILVLAAIAVFFVVSLRSDRGRRMLKNMVRHIKAVGAIFDRQAACHFAGVLGLSLRSGMTEEAGFDMAASLNEDPVFGAKITDCRMRMGEGTSLADALVGSGMFTGMHGRLVAIAGRTGMLDDQLEQLSDQMEAEVDDKTSRFIGALEPTLVILLSLIVGVILLSVMVPLLGILAGL